jgi:hypothetical protein
MITIHDVKQGSETWHKLRREVAWTGSTVIHLLKGKVRPPEILFTNKWTERGKLFEPQALLAYKMATGREYTEVGFVTNDEYPTCGYSPDGISGDTLLEVKCFNGDRHRMLLREEIPAEVIAQIQFGMMVCELNEAQLIAYNPNDSDANILYIIDIPRDEKIIANIKKRLG